MVSVEKRTVSWSPEGILQ